MTAVLSCSRPAPRLSQNVTRLARMAIATLPFLAATVLQAQGQFAATPVGLATAAQSVTVAVTGTTGAVATVEVLTAGAANLDYTESGSDNCLGVTSGNNCSVPVVFSPKYPGGRNGAVVLLDAANKVVGTTYLSGIGQGALGVMIPGAIGIAAGQVGEWTQVNDGSLATGADLYLPSGVAVDGLGDIFIADSHHNRVREVLAVARGLLPVGAMTTVAGDGNAGYDATATVATNTSLNVPGAVAVDGAGNLYIADTNNNVIRKVDPTGLITTVAGDGAPGYTGDTHAATSATLNSPQGIAVDSAGDLFIADTGNNVIREVSASTGTITTVVGDGSGTAGFAGDGNAATTALLNAPYGVAFDTAGNLYIADSGNNRVRRVSAALTISTYAGNGTPAYLGDGGAATSAELYSPLGVACDPAGNVYIADARNYVVRKVNAASGRISTVAGNNASELYNDGKSGYTYGNSQSGEKFSGGGIAAGAPGSVAGAGIYAPYGVAVDSTGNLLIAEYFDHIIRKVTANAATLFFSPQYWQNQISPPQAQKLENDGYQATLTFSAVTPDANSAVDSGSTTTCTSSSAIAVGSQCSVGAEFAPTSTVNPPPNPFVAGISVTGNVPNSPYTIQLVAEELLQTQVNVALTTTPNPSNFGSAVTVSVHVANCGSSCTHGTPSGTVSFSDTFQGATTVIGTTQTLDANGNASIQVSNLAVGTHVLSASYGGNTYYSLATSNSVSQVVEEQVTVALASSSANNTSILGAPVTFTASVSVSGGLAVTGTVTFNDGGNYLGSGSLNGSGVATFSTAGLPVGSNAITATYTDSNNVTGTSAVLTQLVQQQTVTTVGSSVNPSVHGSPVTFTATVVATGSVAPGGSAIFFDAGTQIGSARLATVSGATAAASFQTSSLAAGTHSITATYGGDTNDLSSGSQPLAQTVNIASSTVGLTASANPAIAGKSLVLTATVTTNGGVAGGTVDFYNGSTLLGAGTLSKTGVATWSTSALAVGSYSLTAAYQGDANDNSSTSSALSLSVIQATTRVQLATSKAAVTVTTPVTFTATVTGNGGVPGGNVTFMDGANNLGSALSAKGVATFTTSALSLGQHSITAVYAGDADDAGSTSLAVTENVAAYATATVLAASSTSVNSDQQLSLLATTTSVSGKPVSGTVTFMNGSSSLGTATVSASGTAELNLTLKEGTYNITAQYSGDSVDGASTSNAVSVKVSQATEFTIQLTPASITIPTSQYANIGINLTSENGFGDQMALGCSSLPLSITCNFANNDVTLNANGSVNVQLTVDTNSPLASGAQAQSKNEGPNPGNGILAACVFPGTAFFGFALWRFRRRTAVLKVLIVAAMLAGTTFLMTGCGGFSLNSAKTGTYVIQVTATGEKTGVTHVANLTVQVTQ